MARPPIVLTIRYVDGGGTRKTFKTLEGARKFAQERFGRRQETGGSYVTDDFGTSVMYAHGASFAELFPERDEAPFAPLASCEDCRKKTRAGYYDPQHQIGEDVEGGEHHAYCEACQARDKATIAALDPASRRASAGFDTVESRRLLAWRVRERAKEQAIEAKRGQSGQAGGRIGIGSNIGRGGKVYIVYVDGDEVGMIRAANHNAAEKKAQSLYPGHMVSVAYTEI